jgi:hypothetical protein
MSLLHGPARRCTPRQMRLANCWLRVLLLLISGPTHTCVTRNASACEEDIGGLRTGSCGRGNVSTSFGDGEFFDRTWNRNEDV